MLGMRSFRLKTRAEAAEAAVKKNLPTGFTASVESRVLIHSSYSRYARYANFGLGENKWKPKQGDVIDAHGNIKNQTGDTVAQVVGKEFSSGKPEVRYLDPSTPVHKSICRADRNKGLANGIAKTIKRKGFFLFKPKVAEGIEPQNSHMSYW